MSLYFGDSWIGQIEKPYWWDLTDDELLAKIREHSPMWDVETLVEKKRKVDYDAIVAIHGIMVDLDGET